MPRNPLVGRPKLHAAIRGALRRHPVVALIGPRQAGKTTAARGFLRPSSPRYFDLEDPASLARLDQPMTALAGLLRQSSESLAGRIETLTLTGFRLDELGESALERHWRRGGFPPAFLARSEPDSARWRAAFITTLLERDLPQLGVRIAATTLRRFWTMLAHYHGRIWNAAEPARSLGRSQPTVRQYLDLLTQLFMIRQLQPWHGNLLKRQVKSPKVYVRDSGLLHTLLGIADERSLLGHPKLGSSWEGYAIEEIVKVTEPDESYFWATHGGAELDLLLVKRGRRYGFEIKREDAPRLTPSMRIALEDLRLRHLTVLYPGPRSYQLAPRVTVQPLRVLGWGDPRVLLPSGPPRRRQ